VSEADFEIHWIDSGREPTHPSNPNYPDGVDLDMSKGRPFCESALPYPTARCGAFMIKCNRCGTDALVTTAGRRDDPRSIKLACRNA
jgi:hypothetical protein